MEIALIVVALVALLAVGALVRAARQRDEAARSRDEASQELSAVKAANEARMEQIERARQDLDTHFKGMAAEVLSANSETFLKQAKQQLASHSQLSEADLEKRQQAIGELIKPVRENLEKFEKRVNEMEDKRTGAYEGLKTEVGLLRDVTGNLGEALRSSQMRGHWGEQQLRNVLELSGMSERIDFFEQLTVGSGDSTGRPDAVVRVPGGAQVVIDAKTPLDSYLEAHNTSDDQRRQQELLQSHAGSLMGHARTLGGRNYDAAVAGSPDFVVMFVPADPILDSALDVQPTLWQDAWEKHQVLIATPGLLLAFLKTVALAWKEQSLQENARQIADASKELYDRLRIYFDHVAKMGRGLEQAVNSYNAGIGSLDSRVLPQARRLEELDTATTKKIDAPLPVDRVVRLLSVPEYTAASEVPSGSKEG
ncbi:MAG: DNA recombination protein RmuC [bacterium]|nr:DNA recombination protein RmuC [bacterium]MDE0668813.1 DNA recombination protein RmuC [bacterium]